MSAGWEGNYGQCLVARHEWKGLSKLGGKLEDFVAKETDERDERERSGRLRRSQRLAHRQRASARRLPGHYTSLNDEDDNDEVDDEDYVD